MLSMKYVKPDILSILYFYFKFSSCLKMLYILKNVYFNEFVLVVFVFYICKK